jgi:Xaa-Pro dipeptidase
MRRRTFLGGVAASLARRATAQTAVPPEDIRALKPMNAGVKPIEPAERAARIEKARRLMRENKVAAVYMESGSTMFYYTGLREAGTGLLLPAAGEPVWIAPPAAAARLGGDVRAVPEGGEPYRIIAGAMGDRKASAGRVGLEEQVRFAVFDGLRSQLPALEFVNATPVTAGCRVFKSPAELALMQHANDVTVAAFRAAFGHLREGMTQNELGALISGAHQALGFRGSAMVAFGKFTAFPHGSVQPQQLRPGDFVLVDGGCSVEGYQSDITRTLIFGKPSPRQLEIWKLERRAQDAALAAARPGATCESVDGAARKVITAAGFGPDYKVPGLPHRTGHGIGLDGHEWTNLVRGNLARLEPGMCFSDEPMIAIYGEFGVRLEDCFYMTDSGPRTFSRQSPAIDQPFA